MAALSTRPITVSIVSHGQQTLVLPLLAQLAAHCAASIDKLVLTVNVPEPDLVTHANFAFPIEQITNDAPRGFGANHNAAFQRCASEWFLVLNPDIRLHADVLEPLRRAATDKDGVLTPRIVEPGRDRPEPHRDILTLSEILARRRKNYQAPEQPAWIPGMFMLFRAATYHQIGGFDQRFFMYGEDFDVCARLWLKGWRIRAVDHLQVQHEAQRASQREYRHLWWHITSLMKVWSSAAFWRYRAARARGL